MTGATPGPWAVPLDDDGVPFGDVTQGSSGDYIADVMGLREQEPEAVANARLIASSPSLLAACEDAVNTLAILTNRHSSGKPNALVNRTSDRLQAAIRSARAGEGE